MKNPTETYVATAVRGEHAVVVIRTPYWPTPDDKRHHVKVRRCTQPTTNPQAVALGLLWLLQEFKNDGITMYTNLQAAAKYTPWPDQPRVPAPGEERSFASLMNKVMWECELTGSSVRWLEGWRDWPMYMALRGIAHDYVQAMCKETAGK